MDSPEPGSIRIRLAIDIPPGAAGPPKVRAFGHADLERFQNPKPPDNPEGPWPVLPDPATGLGTICGEVTYPAAQHMVWALVYPVPFYPQNPSPTHPRPAAAVPGVSSDGGFVWRWGAGSPPVPGAAHSTAGAPNRLAVWFQTSSGGAEVFDGSSQFKGKTDPVPCGSGSGSGSGMMVGQLAGAVLEVTVPDGPLKGCYRATPVANLTWKVAVKGSVYTIASANGYDVSIQGCKVSAASAATTLNPFCAVFDGGPFGATAPVVVMRA